MRAIDADKIYKSLDDKYYPHERFVKIEDILEVIENQPELKTIIIPDNATNGDVIKAVFPDAQIDYHEKSDLVDEYVTVFLKDCDTCQDYSYDWWSEIYNKQQDGKTK